VGVGDNYYGQVGGWTTTNRFTPVQVSGLSGVITIAAGQQYSLALKSDGTVWDGDTIITDNLATETLTTALFQCDRGRFTDAVAIAAGTYHAVALKADGTVWDWGYNAYGQLGDGQ